MRRAEVLKKKIYQSGVLRRPVTRQKKNCWKLMIRMPAESSTTFQAVMDDESYIYFINTRLLEDLFVFLKRKGARRWEIQADSEKNRR